MKVHTALFACFVSLLMVSQGVSAGVSLDRTRIIFNESDKNQTISVMNDSDNLYLVQNTILTDYTDEHSESVRQFVTIPPLARLEKQSNNAIRILPKNLSSQPADRESLFFFVVNFIPEGKRAESGDKEIAINFNIATKMIIKVFYRPDTISGDVDDFAGALIFQMSGKQLVIKNPSGYYYTLEFLSLGGQRYQAERAPMIAPFSSLELPVSANADKAQWRVINDFGGSSELFTAEIKKQQYEK